MPTSKSAPLAPEILAIDKQGVVLIPDENDLYISWKPSAKHQYMKEPKFIWKRAKIPHALWEQVVCFLRWSQRKHRDEAMVTFFFNAKENKWAAEIFPQRGRGMTVELLEKDSEYTTLRAKYGKDWTQCGSVHHHCTMKAFMSGTDADDERDRDGVHITLGEITDAEIDTHIRVSFNGTLFNSTLQDWIEMPAWYFLLPPYVTKHLEIDHFALTLPDNVSFPDEWKARLRQSSPQSSCGVLWDGISGMGNYQQEKLTFTPGEKKTNGATILTGKETAEAITQELIRKTTEHIPVADDDLSGRILPLVSKLCNELSLTVSGMRNLLSADEVEQSIMRETNDPDWHILTQLRAQLCARNISPLYVEAMLDRLL